MQSKTLSIHGCLLFTPKLHSDHRGTFFEWFQDSSLTDLTKSKFDLAQANCSISDVGVIRGIHFAGFPPGQAKYVMCLTGKVFDVVVDVRIGSPTFGKWESVILDSANPQMLYIPDGIGHGFMAMESGSIFVYLCDEKYNPENEHDINAFDADLNIKWPEIEKSKRSNKDETAMSFKEAKRFMPNIKDFN